MAKSKNVVKFVRGDGFKPRRLESGAIELFAAAPATLGVSSPITVKLGLIADRPLLVGSTKIALTKTLFLPGEEIVLEGTTRVSSITFIGPGERIALALPFFPVDFEIE